MKKLTLTFNATWMLAILFSTVSVQGMNYLSNLFASLNRVSSEVVQRCAEAVYEEEIGEYVRSHLSHLIRHITSANVHDWKFALFQDIKTNEYIVAFRGVDNLYNKFQVVGRQQGYIDEMNTILNGWENKYGVVPSIFTGHSQGGYFTERCKTSWDVWRITWNGRQSTSNWFKKTLAFGTEKDWLRWLPNNSRHNVKTKKKDHGIRNFREPACKGWEYLTGCHIPNFPASDTAGGPQVPTINFPESNEENQSSNSDMSTILNSEILDTQPTVESESSTSYYERFCSSLKSNSLVCAMSSCWESLQNQCGWIVEGTSELVKIECEDVGQLYLKKNMLPEINKFFSGVCAGKIKNLSDVGAVCDITLDTEKLWDTSRQLSKNCTLILLNQIKNNINKCVGPIPFAINLALENSSQINNQIINSMHYLKNESWEKIGRERLRPGCAFTGVYIGNVLAGVIMPLRTNYSWWFVERAFFQICEMSIYKAIPRVLGIGSQCLHKKVCNRFWPHQAAQAKDIPLPLEVASEDKEREKRRGLLEGLGFTLLKGYALDLLATKVSLKVVDEPCQDPKGLIWGGTAFEYSARGRKYHEMDSDTAAWYCYGLNGRLPSETECNRLAGYLGKNSESGYHPKLFPEFSGLGVSKKFMTSTVVESGPLEGLPYLFDSETGTCGVQDRVPSVGLVLYVFDPIDQCSSDAAGLGAW